MGEWRGVYPPPPVRPIHYVREHYFGYNGGKNAKGSIVAVLQSDYDEKMLSAFVSKPAKMPFYRDLYNRAMRLGSPKLCWKWSWWAFFGGIFFPLYRKAYLAALGILGVSFVLSVFMEVFAPTEKLMVFKKMAELGMLHIAFTDAVPAHIEHMMREIATYSAVCCAAFLCFWILIGGFAPYFVIKRYCDLKEAIEGKYAEEGDRVSTMALHGGFNRWAVVLPIVLIVIFNVFLLLIVFAAANTR
ncbi:MAG: DUF2628 domain-containing protein [Helicobacteraceae bacterium]|nr:DUF2628 domain-containing protein [Helicobacteraceae bacterium]